MPLNRCAERIACVNGIHFFVKVNREADKKNDDECCQKESAKVVWHQVVPFGTVNAGCITKVAQTVVRKDVKSLKWRPKIQVDKQSYTVCAELKIVTHALVL